MVSNAEYAAMQAEHMTEGRLQACVIAAAKRTGWLVYHTYDSRRSQPGYPDLHLVHPARGRSLFRELKTQKGKTTTAQREWLAGLAAAGADAGVWRPIDWFTGAISKQLADGMTITVPADPVQVTGDTTGRLVRSALESSLEHPHTTD